MATTDQLQDSEATICALLLPRLLEIWLPDYNPDYNAAHKTYTTPSNEPARKLRIPPLIAFLEGLPDVVTPNGSMTEKRFPCGHAVYLRSILACCNLLGDAIWTPGPYRWGCADPECEDLLELPKIPDPRVLDGLAVRLDLIEWSWETDEPLKPERDAVRLLRDILSEIGHLSPEPEPETHAESSQRKASKDSLKQTLVQVEIEALAMILAEVETKAETPVRGTQPYCSYRDAMVPHSHHPQLRYPMLSPGQECDCVTPHEFQREARSWALTPAETPLDDDDDDDDESTNNTEPTNKTKNSKPKKTVRFVAPVVVTQVQYFEPWWCDEYRDSDRYWSRGPTRLSTDTATAENDEWAIKTMENPALLADWTAKVAAMEAEARDQGYDSENAESESESEEDWEEEVRVEMDKRVKEALALMEEDTDVEDA